MKRLTEQQKPHELAKNRAQLLKTLTSKLKQGYTLHKKGVRKFHPLFATDFHSNFLPPFSALRRGSVHSSFNYAATFVKEV